MKFKKIKKKRQFQNNTILPNRKISNYKDKIFNSLNQRTPHTDDVEEDNGCRPFISPCWWEGSRQSRQEAGGPNTVHLCPFFPDTAEQQSYRWLTQYRSAGRRKSRDRDFQTREEKSMTNFNPKK